MTRIDKAKKREDTRKCYKKQKGLKEPELYPELSKMYPNIIWMDAFRPDGYDKKAKCFVEVKLASPKKNNVYHQASKHFPGLYFNDGRHPESRRSIDNVVKDYPKPLFMIILDAYTGKVIKEELLKDAQPEFILDKVEVKL